MTPILVGHTAESFAGVAAAAVALAAVVAAAAAAAVAAAVAAAAAAVAAAAFFAQQTADGDGLHFPAYCHTAPFYVQGTEI